ncbi:MAG: single-stranded DNA-binding protein [candidate division KSB1 bacterium]|nr:single-stranded DNA-binding protein [candidate division KSB1 bacterium]
MALGRGTVNKVILLGRLGADPELRYTPGGAAVATISVATNMVWKDKDGNQQDKTEWHRVVAWRRTAEFLGEYVKKGALIYVEGRLETRNWEDKDGVKRYTTEVIADSIETVGGRKEDRGSADMPAPDSQQTSGDDKEVPPPEDDLPF